MERWTVHWHTAPPVNEQGDQPPDDAVPHRVVCDTYADAQAKAVEVAPLDWFGVASIRHWMTVSKSELDAALQSDCGPYELDTVRRVIWLADVEIEEVEPPPRA